MSDDLTTLQTGLDSANDPDPIKAKAKTAERADVAKWMEKLKKTRKFDEQARRQYAFDRKYARGDSSFDVDDNIIGTFIDIMVSFLYAQNPACDVSPAKCAEVPDIDLIKEVAEEQAQQDPSVAQAVQMSLAAFPGDMQLAELAKQAAIDVIVQKQYQAMKEAFNRKQREAKAFADTLELVITRLWKDAKLKKRAKPWVRSMLTVGPGWLKASWQERMGEDPITRQKINDLQDNINRAAALRADIEEDGGGADLDADIAEYKRQLTALEGKAEKVIARGFVIDNVQAEQIQVAGGVAIEDYLDASWIAHYIPMPKCDAVSTFKLTEEQAKKLQCYKQRKPVMLDDKSGTFAGDGITAKDADEYVSSSDQGGEDSGGDYAMCVEIWNRDANCVMTALHGLPEWARPAYTPKPTSRFYPFLLFCTGTIDGQRHPQSKVTRSAKLVDDYNRTSSKERTHRNRIIPKTVFNRAMLTPEDVSKIENATENEMVGVEPVNPAAPINDLFAPVTYAALDPGVYDTSRLMAKLERVWGIQEALTQVTTQKTATEAQIQDTGFQARTGSDRDAMEDALGELALYTAEVALANMTGDDVRKMVGADAMWQQITSPEELNSLVEVDILAGSSGKPNTTAERQQWSVLLPQLTAAIQQIGQLRQSTPEAMADSLEEVVRITVDRSGDNLNIDQIIPQSNGQPIMPAMPGAMPGQVPPAAAAPPAEPTIPTM